MTRRSHAGKGGRVAAAWRTAAAARRARKTAGAMPVRGGSTTATAPPAPSTATPPSPPPCPARRRSSSASTDSIAASALACHTRDSRCDRLVTASARDRHVHAAAISNRPCHRHPIAMPPTASTIAMRRACRTKNSSSPRPHAAALATASATEAPDSSMPTTRVRTPAARAARATEMPMAPPPQHTSSKSGGNAPASSPPSSPSPSAVRARPVHARRMTPNSTCRAGSRGGHVIGGHAAVT